MSRKEYLFDNVAFESLLKEIPGKEYSDFVVECGGDIYRYRIYGNNENNYQVFEK